MSKAHGATEEAGAAADEDGAAADEEGAAADEDGTADPQSRGASVGQAAGSPYSTRLQVPAACVASPLSK